MVNPYQTAQTQFVERPAACAVGLQPALHRHDGPLEPAVTNAWPGIAKSSCSTTLAPNEGKHWNRENFVN